MTSRLLAAAALAALAGLPARAQRAPAPAVGTPRGLFVGAGLEGSRITLEDPDEDRRGSGRGLTVKAGYAFRNGLALFLDGTGSRVRFDDVDEDFTLAHVDVGAQYHFAVPTRAWAPFVEVAFGRRRLSAELEGFTDPDMGEVEDGSVELLGRAVSLGGGLQLFLTPRLALDAAARFTSGDFDEITVEVDGDSFSTDDFELDATTTRLRLGLVWYPRVR